VDGLPFSLRTIKLDRAPPHILRALFSSARDISSAWLRCSANLTDAGVATLANSLSHTGTLTSFHLDDCHLTACQLQVFSRALPGFKISDLSLLDQTIHSHRCVSHCKIHRRYAASASRAMQSDNQQLYPWHLPLHVQTLKFSTLQTTSLAWLHSPWFAS
jgi:hypothetical protein